MKDKAALPKADQPDPDFVHAGAELKRVHDEAIDELEKYWASSRTHVTGGTRSEQGFLAGALSVLMNRWTVMASAVIAAALFVVCHYFEPWWGPLPTRRYHVGMAVGVVIGYLILLNSIQNVFDREDLGRPSVSGLLLAATCYVPLLAGIVMVGITFHTPRALDRKIGGSDLRVPWSYLQEGAWSLTGERLKLGLCWPHVTRASSSGKCPVEDQATLMISTDSPTNDLARMTMGRREVESYPNVTDFSFKLAGIDYQVRVRGDREPDWLTVKPRIIALVASWRQQGPSRR